jgi:hypothetical protein
LGYEFKMIRMLDLKVNTFESHSGEVSRRLVLLVEETGVPGENNQAATSNY